VNQIKIVQNCYCTGCKRYYAGPPGKYKDEISIIRCGDCHETSENGAYEVKLKWIKRRDGSKKRVKAIAYY
jgi:hypothetical protein